MRDQLIQSGIGLVFAVVLAIIAVGLAGDVQYDNQFTIDSEEDWNDYWENSDSTELTVNTDGYIEIADEETTGTYESIKLDENESDSTVYKIETEIAESDNSSAEFTTAGGTDYELEDGANTVELDSSTDSFNITLDRDSADTTSPQVHTVEGLTDSDSQFLATLMMMMAAVFLLLSLAAPFTDIMGSPGRP